MIRHIFIAPIKDGISEEKLNKEISLMKAMKDNIPEIVSLTIGKNTGWVGGENAVTMVVDLKDKAAFDIYMKHPYHAFINSINGTEDEVMNYLHNIYQGLVRYLKYEDCGEILATGVGYSNIDENSEFLKQAYELGKNLKGE